MAVAAILKIRKKCNISAMERPILTKFGTVMRLGPADTNSKQKFTISKIQDGGGRHLEKSQILISSQPIDQYLQNLAR